MNVTSACKVLQMHMKQSQRGSQPCMCVRYKQALSCSYHLHHSASTGVGVRASSPRPQPVAPCLMSMHVCGGHEHSQLSSKILDCLVTCFTCPLCSLHFVVQDALPTFHQPRMGKLCKHNSPTLTAACTDLYWPHSVDTLLSVHRL